MSRITDVKVLSKFNSSIDGKTCGVYQAKFNGENKIFVENSGSIAVVSHFLNKPASECLSTIREDVAEELREALND